MFGHLYERIEAGPEFIKIERAYKEAASLFMKRFDVVVVLGIERVMKQTTFINKQHHNCDDDINGETTGLALKY